MCYHEIRVKLKLLILHRKRERRRSLKPPLWCPPAAVVLCILGHRTTDQKLGRELLENKRELKLCNSMRMKTEVNTIGWSDNTLHNLFFEIERVLICYLHSITNAHS
jgi:hypothetical protein